MIRSLFLALSVLFGLFTRVLADDFYNINSEIDTKLGHSTNNSILKYIHPEDINSKKLSKDALVNDSNIEIKTYFSTDDYKYGLSAKLLGSFALDRNAFGRLGYRGYLFLQNDVASIK